MNLSNPNALNCRLLFAAILFLSLAGYCNLFGGQSQNNQRAIPTDQFPKLQEDFVSDEMRLLIDRMQSRYQNALQNLWMRSEIYFQLATIKAMSDYPEMPQQIDEFAAKLFEHWELQKHVERRTVLLLFSSEDRKLGFCKSTAVSKNLESKIRTLVLQPTFRIV